MKRTNSNKNPTKVLSKALKKVIQDYQEKNPWDKDKHTRQFIADKAMVAKTLIVEIMNDKLRGLSVDRAVDISMRLEGPNTLKGLLDLVEDGPEKSEVAQEFSGVSSLKHKDEEFNYFVKLAPYNQIISAAYTSRNIEKATAVGKWGATHVKVLLEKGIIEEQNGFLVGIDGKKEGSYLNKNVVHQEFFFALDESHPLLGKQGDWKSSKTQSVSEEFYRCWREKLHELYIEFDKEAAKKENQGGMYVRFNMLFTDFLNLSKDSDNKILQEGEK